MAVRRRLSEYERKRSFAATPEPAGSPGAGVRPERDPLRFVVQEHSATRLHWDLRLEHEGALASWALPRGLPTDPGHNRLAVRTEDHPIKYLDFEGTIPAGNYGAGEMRIIDRGAYVAEKFEAGKVVFTLQGERLNGRFAVFRTDGKNWLIHRMDPPDPNFEPIPERLQPMRPTEAEGVPADGEQRLLEIAFGGLALLVYASQGRLALRDAEGTELGERFPELRDLVRQIGIRDALLAGEIVVLDEEGRHDPEALAGRLELDSEHSIRRASQRHPATLLIGDLLHLDGSSLLGAPLAERRERLAELALEATSWRVSGGHVGDAEPMLEAARRAGVAVLHARRLDAPYRPGASGPEWLLVAAGE